MSTTSGQLPSGAMVPQPRTPGDQQLSAAPGKYAEFKVLLDDPATEPGLGFAGYATSLAQMITDSRADFAIGIFGSWGSGKTTLMRKIQRTLSGSDDLVTVWFNAWRYEKDPHLIVPLLDVLREALEEKHRETKAGWARTAAVRVGKAGQALLAGLRLTAAAPAFQVEIDTGKIMKHIEKSKRPEVLSFYHAGFTQLRDAITGLSDSGGSGRTRRVVIFVDDLDRCMPEKALELLESVKLFFDIEGCVFVVGLDPETAQQAVAVKYPSSRAGEQQRFTGTEYVKKIFQVPFELPPIRAGQMLDYLDVIEANSGFGPAQRADFRSHVRKHFRVLRAEGPVNLREIKRLVNSYTMQLKMLSSRLPSPPDENVVLTLLCMAARADWQDIYGELLAEPALFQKAVRDALATEDWPREIWVGHRPIELGHDFWEYLKGDAQAFRRVEDLGAYISAAAVALGDPWVIEARAALGRLRRSLAVPAEEESGLAERARELRAQLSQLVSLIASHQERFGRLGVLYSQLGATVSRLGSLQKPWEEDGETVSEATIREWSREAMPLLEDLDRDLREVQRYLSLNAS